MAKSFLSYRIIWCYPRPEWLKIAAGSEPYSIKVKENMGLAPDSLICPATVPLSMCLIGG